MQKRGSVKNKFFTLRFVLQTWRINMWNIILASGSPRRKELLEQLGIPFEIKKSEKEEIITSTLPEQVVVELAKQKAEDVFTKIEKENTIVIGADTIVSYKNQILGKPKDREMAISMLNLLNGKRHDVYTGVSIWIEKEKDIEKIHFYEKTEVEIMPMTKKQIIDYVDTKEPMDKAGAYAIQGKFAIYIKAIHGDYYNVVGFPIAGIYQKLYNRGIDWTDTTLFKK